MISNNKKTDVVLHLNTIKLYATYSPLLHLKLFSCSIEGITYHILLSIIYMLEQHPYTAIDRSSRSSTAEISELLSFLIAGGLDLRAKIATTIMKHTNPVKRK